MFETLREQLESRKARGKEMRKIIYKIVAKHDKIIATMEKLGNQRYGTAQFKLDIYTHVTQEM